MSALETLANLPAVYMQELFDARDVGVPEDSALMIRFRADYEALLTDIATLEQKARELIKRYQI